jgi:hypothetical protein
LLLPLGKIGTAFKFTLGDNGGIWPMISSTADASGEQHVTKTAAKPFAVQYDANVPIRQGQRVLVAATVGLADRAGRGAIAAVPPPP